MLIRKKSLFFMIIVLLFVVSGCFKGERSNVNNNESNDINDRSEITNDETNDDRDAEDEDESASETAVRELYLMNVDGLIVGQQFELPIPESKEVATQVLQYLVKDGPVTDILPNGFQAVLPEGTEVLSINLQDDGSIVVDFSEEFLEYHPDHERKILEAVTFTLTQFDSINRVFIRVNGEQLTEMPMNGTPIEKGYSRAQGINFIQTDALDFIASEPVTIYYPSEYNDERYFVPVTQHIEVKDGNLFESIVNALIEGPRYDTNVIHVFNSNTMLVEAPTLNDGVLELVFNDMILKDADRGMIADEVMETLTKTLTEYQNVNAISVKVEDYAVIVNEDGEEYVNPVTMEAFQKKEKL